MEDGTYSLSGVNSTDILVCQIVGYQTMETGGTKRQD